VEEAISAIRQIVANIPDTSLGVERQMLIGNLCSRQSPEERLLIKNFFDGLLQKMPQITASDIDLGGYGSQGKVWFRVTG